jgi:hypothetical protein
MQFTKLFSCILDSTIWQEPPQTKILWITMLAMSDRNGDVHASIPGLAKRAGITMDECERGIACLLAPDRYSRTKDHEGRRIAVIDGGWTLLNHGKYRALLSAEERREYNRQKQAEHRLKLKMSANVNDSKTQSAMSAHTEAEAEANTETEKEASAPVGASKSQLQLRVEKLMRRRESTPLNPKEVKTYKAALPAIEATTEEQWVKLERFYAAPQEKTFARKDLLSLLNNWNGEIDKAEGWAGQQPAGTRVPSLKYV